MAGAPVTRVDETRPAALTEKNYVGLVAARTGLAAFIQRSEREARAAGATHTQHHVLLALRGHDDTTAAADAPALRVKDVAAALGIARPSAVELITRMVTAGLLRRQKTPEMRAVPASPSPPSASGSCAP